MVLPAHVRAVDLDDDVVSAQASGRGGGALVNLPCNTNMRTVNVNSTPVPTRAVFSKFYGPEEDLYYGLLLVESTNLPMKSNRFFIVRA